MNILLNRDRFYADTTLGTVSLQYGDLAYFPRIGWHANDFPGCVLPFGFSCEDEDRGLYQDMPTEDIARLKFSKETAIPLGTYMVKRTWSPKFQRDMMLVHDVPGFSGIRIHSGNDEGDTAGCVLIGLTRDENARRIGKSKAACDWLDARVAECEARGEMVKLVVY